MPPEMKTPGVYIIEQNAFPNSVVEVATAVPAFVGYTERADDHGKSLAGRPRRIQSLAEYRQYFGGAPAERFELKDDAKPADAVFSQGGKNYRLEHVGARHLLYYCMAHFFQNGGSVCYVVSVGTYGTGIDAGALKGAITALEAEAEPTLLVIPECVQLADRAACADVQRAMIAHCGLTMRNRVAILDVYGGGKSQQENRCIENFRDDVGSDHLDFAAAYYPWLHTNVVPAQDVTDENVANLDALVEVLKPGAKVPAKSDEKKAFLDSIPLYKSVLAAIRDRLNLLPPSPAMAGIYAMVDGTRGVWKAPANVSVTGVSKPAVNVSVQEQQDLNVSPQGKSINAIRDFIGEGVMVWGARTIDGNNLDFRYVNVRRTMIMIEESCKLAVKAYAFEPNVATTWITIRSMLENFLTSLWKRGGLAGTKPNDAFSVHCGLGDSMTPEDVAAGILRVTVLVAVIRPAEFIECSFQQTMPKS